MHCRKSCAVAQFTMWNSVLLLFVVVVVNAQSSRTGASPQTTSFHAWRLVSRVQQEVYYCCPCGVGQATCSECGLDIASNSGLEGDQVIMWHRKAWWAGVSSGSLANLQRVSCDNALLLLHTYYIYIYQCMTLQYRAITALRWNQADTITDLTDHGVLSRLVLLGSA